ncbi:hypothetical protein NA57DRAFT_59153 [Rhizodiscina lignyota]|uniref:Uncharacterized protein n=1 Tax=Rhizodiscina lignyota TaxID=1504668 RepID=A0A9P4IBY4_9PEZI|nr:hypothetical protein NA57DRAFT_59153 [Rhizodiscina lignyota]
MARSTEAPVDQRDTPGAQQSIVAERSERCIENTPFRGFFLIAQPYWPKIERYLREHDLAYEYFHASFINTCHKLTPPLMKAGHKKDWEVRIYEILRESPVSSSKYVEALEIFRHECDPPPSEIVGGPIRFTDDRAHKAAQLALYSKLFTHAERVKLARERKETETLALATLVDALDDIERPVEEPVLASDMMDMD